MADKTTDNPGYYSKLHNHSEMVNMKPTKANHPKAISNVYVPNPKASSGDYVAIHQYETLRHEVVVPSTNEDNVGYSTVGVQIYEDPGHNKEKIYAWFEKKKFRILDRNDIKYVINL